jgi:post-segregation antitoxin (ccd killing protein)
LNAGAAYSTNTHDYREVMRMNVYDPSAAKGPVNLTMNGDLVARGRAAGLNLSALVVAGL